MRLHAEDDGWGRDIYLFEVVRLFGHWFTAGTALAWLAAMVVVSGADPAWMGAAFWASAVMSLLFILGCTLWFAAGVFDGFAGAQPRQ